MSYRVTNNMMSTALLNDMHTNLSKLLEIQQQMSTQRKYNSATENPNAVTKGMSIDTMMVEGEQYIKNLQDAVSWLKFTDSALGGMNDVFQRIRELTIYAGDGSLTDVDRKAIADELIELKEELRSLANSTIAGEYLFAGLKTCEMPFTIGANGEIDYNGNDYKLFWEFARQQTGQVSVSGRDVFPVDEITNSLKGIELPLDFEWSGRGEILEFKVGWRTVKVRIPEKWEDEIRNGIADSTDYNRYRDPGELECYSLQEIADLINNSTEMGDVAKLLSARVVTDNDRGVQYLVIESHTGEAVSLTSWPETDAVQLGQGIMGAAYGPVGRTAAADGTMSFRFDASKTYDVEIAAGDDLKAIADKLNSLSDAAIWASYKNDGTNEWIDIVARDVGSQFTMESTGGAVALFAPQHATAQSTKMVNVQGLFSNKFDTTLAFEALSTGSLVIRQGYDTYTVDVAKGDELADIVTNINAETGGRFTASIEDGALKILAADNTDFEVTAFGGALPLFDSGVQASSGGTADENGYYTLETFGIAAGFQLPNKESGLGFEYGDKTYWVPLVGNETMAEIAAKLQTALAGVVGTPAPTVEVVSKLDADGREVEVLQVKTGSPISLFGYGAAADVMGKSYTASDSIKMNSDHTHIGFAAMMGMETTVKSTEFIAGSGNDVFDTITTPLHFKFVSGSRRAEVYIDDAASLTIEELAARINGVCGDWMQVTVEIDQPDGSVPISDPLNNSQDNLEQATKRLVFRTLDGEPFAIYDGPGKDPDPAAPQAGTYAKDFGISTALTGLAPDLVDGKLSYPDAAAGSSFDTNMPAILEVTVGEKVFTVKVCENNCPTAEKVAAAIVRQVNEQYGGTLLAWDGNDIANSLTPGADAGTFALYAVTGEPLRVVDQGYGDPRYSDYTGGVASQLGIGAGITSSNNTIEYQDTFGTLGDPGVIRISTPGHSIDVPVLATDNMHTLANRIRDYAGSWLDVSFSSSIIDDPAGLVSLSFAAKDGSALSVIDVSGDIANTIGIDTGFTGTVDLKDFPVYPDMSADATFTIDVNGASHTIDLVDNSVTPPKSVLNSIEDLADMINTRFQGQDIRAEVIVTKDAAGVITSKQLALWSPKGYSFSVTGTGDVDDGSGGTVGIPEAFGFTDGAVSPSPNGSGPYNQEVVQRTGNNQKQTDFFGVMDDLISTVQGGDVDGISDIMIEKLDSWMTTLLKCRSQVGALTNRYTTTETRYTLNNTDYTELYTQVVGVDLAEVITQYEMASSVYQASLAAIARIMQTSLLDFLR